MRVNAVIVAAGEGKRMNSPTTKVFLSLQGRPVLLHTLRRFAATRAVEKTIVVVAEKDLTRCEALIRADRDLAKVRYVVQSGGTTRRESVRQGLTRLDHGCDLVVIHDGARPLVPISLIDRCIEVAWKEGAAVVGLPARDTIKMIKEDGRVCKTVSRESFWLVQTPQAFRRELIIRAYEAAVEESSEVTDDAALVERIGEPVVFVEGDPRNIKVTVPEDLSMAEALMQEKLVT
jgi:2-C-methyl-D-erythritol 4-phosphate cytidylyltransferase